MPGRAPASVSLFVDYNEGVLLCLDAGERPDEPDALWAVADVLCCACGGHAGDATTMSRVVAFCAGRARPQLGAHPSYPDRVGFGRRTLPLSVSALSEAVGRQCRDLAAVARVFDVPVAWLKPHGALYHDADRSLALAGVVLDAAREALGMVTVIGPAGGALHEAATARGLGYAREGFADRAILPDGALVPRTEPGALITDPAACAARARDLRGVVDAVCVHGDTPGAVEIAAAVRAALDAP